MDLPKDKYFRIEDSIIKDAVIRCILQVIVNISYIELLNKSPATIR